MPSPPRIARIADIPSVRIVDDTVTMHPVRWTLGIGAFGVNAYSGSAGDQIIEEHDEMGVAAGRHEELYLVVSGHATFTVDGEEHDAPAGTLVFVPDASSRRAAVAVLAETTVLVVGGRPGERYDPSPWEGALLAAVYAQQGETGLAREAARVALANHPDHPRVLFNVACAESLLGEREAALEHLRRAIELEPECAEWARTDRDFDPIRDDPRFPVQSPSK
jgi:tetratricopeptide (TPR) repeat protein